MTQKEIYNRGLLAFVIVVLLGMLGGCLEKMKVSNELEQKVDKLEQRVEVITQQLQEMNKYIGYPGG